MNTNMHKTVRKSLAGCLSTLGLCGLLVLTGAAQAQDVQLASSQTTAPPDVQFTVTRQQGDQPQVICVPVNQGALVDFNVPVREVRIANPEVADVTATSPRQILVNGKAFGSTQLLVVVDGGQQRTFTVAVDLDLERLEAAIRQVVPRAKVAVSSLMDSVLLRGTVPDAQSAERITQIAEIYSKHVINHMQVAGVHQVLLRVTVAEVNRAATRRLGFNGWIAGDNHPSAFGISNIAGINPVDISAVSGVNATSRIPFQTGAMGLTATPTLSFGFPQVQMQVFVQALRENGLLQVLAEPNLVTISGEEASFLAGGEFPIPVAQRDSVTVEFREFGVKLNFTPSVLGEDVIRLQVAPEVSEPDYSTAVMIAGYAVPGLVQRKVETVVELAPGQTFAIGGLLSETTRATSSKVPALGDIPVLGALFSSVEYQRDETELVVLVTPELVAALNPDQVVHVPGAEHIPPNDWELFALGKLSGEGDPNRPPSESATRKDWPARTDELYGEPAALRLRGPIGPAGAEEGT